MGLFLHWTLNLCSDVYEGTRTATEADLVGIRQLLQPLEESGTLIQRTDEEVAIPVLLISPIFKILHSVSLMKFVHFCLHYGHSCLKRLIHSSWWREKVISLLVLPFSHSLRIDVGRLLL